MTLDVREPETWLAHPTRTPAPNGRGPRGVRPRRRGWYLLGLAGVVATAAVALVVALRAPPSGPVDSASGSTPTLVARGQVRPVSQARVGTLEGGVLLNLAVEVGEAVAEQQQIARVRGPTGMGVLTAPMRGTVTGVLVHVGDTLLPGAIVLTVGDLSRLQVETTDVDEYIVGSLWRGQPVSMVVDALNRQELQGSVRSISLEPRTTAVGDEHYPVVIDLAYWPPELRPGMTAKITFLE